MSVLILDAPVSDDPFDLDRVAAIAARLDLRQPNREALESIALTTAQHFAIDAKPPPFMGVVDSATGVGKTYIIAAAIEYFAAEGVRNFAIITPGRTILDKTVANFTPGHPKSLLGGMETRPVVITSDNFNTAAMRAAMDDPFAVKLFVFTVQALLKPTSKVGRKTHDFQEGLGEAFYAHLQSLDDLTVFADEHHAYFGKAFSQAVNDLRPRVLLGLTATPHKSTKDEEIIYRYPLAAAIADRLVKTPVIVGRRDDRADPATKLLDGVRLLQLKERAIAHYRARVGAPPVNPVMLVIAPSIADADEIEAIVREPSFANGHYADRVLTVHSNAPDAALEALERLEDPESPIRIVVSVGMLKEGWDVKNVYVIASLRASVSELLTEQTLGRGLRLPFGAYTGIEILDTLEVLGHERYEELLKKAGVLQESFVDWRTRAVLRRGADGGYRATTETTPVRPEIGTETGGAAEPVGEAAGPVIGSIEDVTERGERAIDRLRSELVPRDDLPPLRLPRLRMTPIQSAFSLNDITDLDPFEKLGRQIAADPSDTLRRVTLGARVVTGPDGLRRTELVTAEAVDPVVSTPSLFDLDELRRQLVSVLLNAPVVPAKKEELHGAARIVDAFVAGMGADAEKILSAYRGRAEAGLLRLVTQEQRRIAAKPKFDEVVEVDTYAPKRASRAETSADRFGPFRKGVGYTGYAKSAYAQDWFDSSTERDVANVLEGEDQIVAWVRLQIGDLPILWASDRSYNPDFVAIDSDGIHWLIEVKMDKEMASAEVRAKRQAAKRWANHVSASDLVDAEWRYLLFSETDVRTAKGSWEALKRLGDY